jgi:hypothetical protein
MRTLARAFALSLVLLTPTIGRAQSVVPAGVSRFSQARDSTARRGGGETRFAIRTLTSAVGGAASAFGLGLLGAWNAPDCSCDDPGLKEFLTGFAIGGAVGAGLGAALPRFGGDTCSLGERILRGVGGAAVGSVAGGFLGSRIGETSLAVGWAIGTAIGGPVALIGC